MCFGVGDLLWKVVPARNRDATLAPMFVVEPSILSLWSVVTVASKHIERNSTIINRRPYVRIKKIFPRQFGQHKILITIT